jgi:hypothetical protein
MSTENPEESKPQKIIYRTHLHEGYWYDLAKKIIDDSETNINQSAEKFEKLILWFWGVYTSIVGLGAGGFTVFLGKNISTGTLVGLIIPSVILLLAYWLTTAASTSAILEFEHRSPDSIRDAFLDGLKRKTFFFKTAKAFAFLACLAIPVTIYLANRISNGNFEVLRTETNNSQKILTISGYIPEKGKYEFSFPANPEFPKIQAETESGHFVEKISLPASESQVLIRLWWKESDTRGLSVEKTIELK